MGPQEPSIVTNNNTIKNLPQLFLVVNVFPDELFTDDYLFVIEHQGISLYMEGFLLQGYGSFGKEKYCTSMPRGPVCALDSCNESKWVCRSSGNRI